MKALSASFDLLVGLFLALIGALSALLFLIVALWPLWLALAALKYLFS